MKYLIAAVSLSFCLFAEAQTTQPNPFIANLETSWERWQQDPKRMAFWEEHGWVYEPTIKQLQDRNAPWWPSATLPWLDGKVTASELPEGVEPNDKSYRTWNVEGGTFHLVSLMRLETLFARASATR